MDDNRKSQRHARRLRAVIVCDEPGKPAKTHGKTQDLSNTGAAIISDCNLLSKQPVTVCLLVRPGDQINPPLVFEARSRIISCVLSRQQGGFRISVEFSKIEGDGSIVLKKFLSASMATAG